MPDRKFTKVYGDAGYTMTFLCAVYSRLAYMAPAQFLSHYTKIFGPVIPGNLLEDMNAMVDQQGVKGLTDEATMFGKDKKYPSGLTTPALIERVASGINPASLAFLPWAARINEINGEERISEQDPNCDTDLPAVQNDQLYFITIDTSNYGSVFVFGDLRAPNVVNVVFRGTSNKKSASSYLHPKSWAPTTIATFKTYPIKVMVGVYKLLNEITHTILDAVVQVSGWLNPKAGPGGIKILTSGHSLGGALATLFAFKYVIQISADQGFGIKYPILDRNIACFSLGSPRVLGENASVFFCLLTTQNSALKLGKGLQDRQNAIPKNILGRITYIRSTTLHDPVPGLPKAGYEHPCSTGSGPLSSIKGVYADETARQNINADCLLMAKNSFSTRCGLVSKLAPKLTNNYALELNCKRKKRSLMENFNGPLYSHNPVVFHAQYLGIAFASGVNLKEVLNGKIGRVGQNLLRTQKGIYDSSTVGPVKVNDTMMRLMFYQAGSRTINVVFTDLVPYRDVPDLADPGEDNENYSADLDNSAYGTVEIPEKLAKIPEDIKLNGKNFQQLLLTAVEVPINSESANIMNYTQLSKGRK